MLDRVSLTIVPTSRIGIVAPNGTGKTTLLRILAGLDRADSGTVERHPPTATVGYLPQEADRREGETLPDWLHRIQAEVKLPELEPLLGLHYRYRFDPDGQALELRAEIHGRVEALLRHDGMTAMQLKNR